MSHSNLNVVVLALRLLRLALFPDLFSDADEKYRGTSIFLRVTAQATSNKGLKSSCTKSF